jgi:alcohol dehydrogenase, propanol-preferring
VAWINSACGACMYCISGRENLCPGFKATGRDAHGGYAEWMIAPAAYVHPLPKHIPDEQAAPLLCAGAIGYRSLRLTGLRNGEVLGLTGFGASGHQVLQLCRVLYPESPVMVFARRTAERDLSMAMGATWAGDTGGTPPLPCDAIIDTTPAWRPIVKALGALAPGGRLVINAIRKEATDQQELLELDYPRDLWMEKEIRSVANITRSDVRGFLEIASQHDLLPQVMTYAFSDASRAVLDLKESIGEGAKVLVMIDSTGPDVPLDTVAMQVSG